MNNHLISYMLMYQTLQLKLTYRIDSIAAYNIYVHMHVYICTYRMFMHVHVFDFLQLDKA